MFFDFLVNFLSYLCFKIGKVIKGFYLLEVLISDFGLILLEIGKKG